MSYLYEINLLSQSVQRCDTVDKVLVSYCRVCVQCPAHSQTYFLFPAFLCCSNEHAVIISAKNLYNVFRSIVKKFAQILTNNDEAFRVRKHVYL